MKPRPTRWPSHWALELTSDQGVFAVQITNVSETGLRFISERPLPRLDCISLKAMGQAVHARLIRRDGSGGALEFDRPLTAAQLANLRQYRDFHAI